MATDQKMEGTVIFCGKAEKIKKKPDFVISFITFVTYWRGQSHPKSMEGIPLKHRVQ